VDGWSEVAAHATRLGTDCFMATVDPGGEPHLAVVSPGFTDVGMIVATWQESAKARNLRAGSKVMFHWVVQDGTGNDMLLVKGEPRLVDDSERIDQIWTIGCLPYDLRDWYDGPDDSRLLFVEVVPTYASLHRNFGRDGRTIWRF
jgi:general stress protein 26